MYIPLAIPFSLRGAVSERSGARRGGDTRAAARDSASEREISYACYICMSSRWCARRSDSYMQELLNINNATDVFAGMTYE